VDLRISSLLYDSTMVLPITVVVQHWVGVTDHTRTLPTEYELRQNYPNPFNPNTQIAFDLPRAEHVELAIFNALGQKVATLLDEARPAGYHVLTWDGRSGGGAELSSGVYFCQMKAGRFQSVRKMLLMR
jgi:hypothetical protein